MQNGYFLSILKQLDFRSIPYDTSLLHEVPGQQCEGTIHQFGIIVQNNVKQNTDQILVFGLSPHIQVFVLICLIHPLDDLRVDLTFDHIIVLIDLVLIHIDQIK